MIKRIDKSREWLIERSKTGVFRCFVLITVITIQLIVMCGFAVRKSNFYIDEMFSMGYAHTYIHPREDVVYINFSKDWNNEKWVENSVLKDQLETTAEDSVFTLPLSKALRKLFLGRNYMGMLNIVMSMFSPGKMGKYPPIILNFFIFVMTQLLLYRICRSLSNSWTASLMAITMYGFSAMSIGLSIYIRFYALTILLLAGFARLHQKMWSEDSLWKCEVLTFASMALAYFALKNSELTFIMAGGWIGFYALGLFSTRQWKKAFLYVGTILPISLFYAVFKTPYVDMILHPAAYIGYSGPMGWMTRDLLSMSTGKLIYFVRLYKRWLDEQLTGSRYVTFLYLVIMLILFEVRFLGSHPAGRKGADSGETSLTEARIRHQKGFAGIVLGAELVYLLFCFLTCLPATRYISFLYPFLPLLLWTTFSRLSEGQTKRQFIMAGCAVLMCIGIIAGFLHPERIEYVYMEDRPLIEALDSQETLDSIVIYTDEEDATHVVYDCVNLIPDEAKIYPVQAAHHKIDTSQCPDSLLIWVKNGEKIQPCVSDLETGGYSIEKLGKTHASDVYAARRKQ